MSLKTVIAQLATEAGHLNVNYVQMMQAIEQAKENQADLIVFPELCLSGSCVGDKWYSDEFVRDLVMYNDKITALSEGIAIVWGNIIHQQGKLYDAVLCALDGKIIHVECKKQLCDEGIANEHRYFTAGTTCTDPLVLKNHQIRFVIGSEEFKNLEDCDLVIHVDASSWTLEDDGMYDAKMKELALKKVIHVHCAGVQNTGKNVVLFDGGSAVYENGLCTHRLNDGFVQEIVLIDEKFDHRIEHKLMKGLVSAIREFDRQTLPYGPKWIIGLSGGLHSSVNAALLSMALGSKRICAYNLATKYNSEHTKDNASNLAEALGIELRNGYISEVVDATVKTAEIYGYQEEKMATLVHENIQARIRGHLLSTFAQIENGVIVNNGNKIEVALGYATMYGDSIGAIGPIGDLTKVQLFDLSHEINAYFGKEVIPERLLPVVDEQSLTWEMAPSAELREAQYDPMKWFYHDWLIDQLTDKHVEVEQIMEDYLSGALMNSVVGRWLKYYHLDEGKRFIEDLEWVLRQMRVAVFKRVQGVPIVKVTHKSFGSNCHEVQGTFDVSKRYLKLKEDILRG